MALAVFPTLKGIGYPRMRSLLTKSDIEETDSGRVTGFQIWAYPRRQYVLVAKVLRDAAVYQEWQQLEGFYASVGGRARPWLYNDTKDNSVVGQNFGVGDGTTKDFQLVRTLGGYTVPVFGKPTVAKVTVADVITSSFTVSDTGVLSFTTAPASGAALKWDGSYYWVCRFDNDNMDFNEILSGVHQVDKISFTTEKL